MSVNVSIVIRGKNEEDWLGICLRAINKQTYKNFEIIYVDNQSSDASVKIAREYGVKKIRHIKKYLPGLAINKGIEISEGKLVVILSAHCIPTNQYWLSSMVTSLTKKNIAGSYGRQLPLPFTSPDDARDLLITFGNEDIIQKVEPFFHNANSIIKKSVWEKINFDKNITNIEDRDWAKKVQDKKFFIKYNSKGCVYHTHGLHQHGTKESFRAHSVNNLIKKINSDEDKLPEWFDIDKRICPIVLYGKNINDIESKIIKLIKSNPGTSYKDLYFYGDYDPQIKDITFIKRKISIKAPFYKFTLDILNSLNKKMGFSIEAICFVDLAYKNFIKNSIQINKQTVFDKDTHLSSFAYKDKGNIWISESNKISKISKMYDKNTNFLRLVIGQGAVMRASLIRTKKSDPSDGFTHTFHKIKYLIR